MSAVDAAIQKKIYGSGTTALKLDSHLPKIFCFICFTESP